MRHLRSYGPGAGFEFVQCDQWNQRRSRLNHTDLANGVLWIWGASSRRDEIIEYVTGTAQWDVESRREWELAAAKWQQLEIEIVEHARKIGKEYRPFITAEEFLCDNVAYAHECFLAARQRLAEDERHESWIASVESRVSEVRSHNAVIEKVIKERDAGKKVTSERGEAIRCRLDALAQSGHLLKEIFSGRGYFNHGESD